MFSHPAAVVGFIILAIGWFMLASGGASEYGSGSFINFHSLWMASGMIMTGGTLIVGGVVAGGADQIRQALLMHPDIAAGEAAAQKKDAVRKKAESQYRMTGKKPAKATPEILEADDAEIALERALRERGLK